MCAPAIQLSARRQETRSTAPRWKLSFGRGGVTTLLLTGYATDFCVDATLRSAASKDFNVVVVADAHTTSDNPVLNAEIVRRHHNWAWANAITKKGVTVLKASEVSFRTGVAV